MTAVSSKENNFEYLSPMSLLNSALVSPVLPGQIRKSESGKISWRTSQLMAQDYWKRIYIPTLVPRKKWKYSKLNFNERDLIIIKDISMVKHQWSRGRIC